MIGGGNFREDVIIRMPVLLFVPHEVAGGVVRDSQKPRAQFALALVRKERDNAQ